MLYSETRKRGLVDKSCRLGLSIFYDRVREISTQTGNSIVSRFEEEGLVCPPNLLLELFITAAVDNIDHNIRSICAHGSLHGTAISLYEHRDRENDGHSRDSNAVILTSASKKHLKDLPKSYTEIQPVTLRKSEGQCPANRMPMDTEVSSLDVVEEEYIW